MRENSIVLLSGGLDSVVNLKRAIDETKIELVLTFDYGQKASRREIEAASLIAGKYGLPHRVMKLDYLTELDSGLTRGEIPVFDRSKLDNYSYSVQTAKAVWVPNRNGLFINIAAAFADKLGISKIIVGFNREEGATFPDNTPEFIDKINQSLEYSTQAKPKVHCYTIDKDKTGIVELGIQIGAPYEYVWSCYHDYSQMCGECESCQRLKRALSANGYLEEFRNRNHWGVL